MSIPTITRGRITVIETGITKNFLFNPSELVDTKQVNWGQLDVPGASHPVYQYGTGGERNIVFELYLDGDRGRFGREETQEDISIESEIKFYRSLVYPAKYNETFEAVYPHTLLFSFGQYVNNLHCIMKAAPAVRVTYWNPKLQPVRATVQITLAELSEKSQTSQDIYPVVQIGKGPLQLDPMYISSSIGKSKGGGRVRIGQAVIKEKSSLNVGPVTRVARIDPILIEGDSNYIGSRDLNEDYPDLFPVKPLKQVTQLPAVTLGPKHIPPTTITSRKPVQLPPTNLQAPRKPTQLATTTFFPRNRKT